MEQVKNSLAYYQAAREVLGALSELRMIGQAPVPQMFTPFAVYDPKAVEANVPEPQLKDLMSQPKKRRGKNSTRHPCSSDVNARWQIEFACLDFALSRLGSLTFHPGSGLLRAANDAFLEVEPELRLAQLNPALGQFEVEPFGRHPYVWPIIRAVADATATWAIHIAELWSCYGGKKAGLIKDQTTQCEYETDRPSDMQNRIAKLQATPPCPVSPELLGKLAARLELERAWLASQEKPELTGATVEKRKRGKPKQNRTDDELRIYRLWRQLRNEFEAGVKSGDKSFLTQRVHKDSYEAFFCWLDRTRKVDEDLFDDWRKQGGRNVTKESDRALGKSDAVRLAKSRPQNQQTIRGRKSQKKKLKFSTR